MVFNNIKINENNNSFESFLSGELNNKIGDRIGKGNDGVVYNFGYNNDKVIKITTTDDSLHLNDLIGKGIKGIVKIYHVGEIEVPSEYIENNSVTLNGESKVMDFSSFKNLKSNIELIDNKIGFVIMEKIDTSVNNDIRKLIKEIYKKVFNESEVSNIPEVFNYDKNSLSLEHHNVLYNLYEYTQIDYDLIVSHLSKYQLNDLIFEILEIFKTISTLYPKWDDIHPGQFGRTKNGNLVVFDISNTTKREMKITNENYMIKSFNNWNKKQKINENNLNISIKSEFIKVMKNEFNSQLKIKKKQDDINNDNNIDEWDIDLNIYLIDASNIYIVSGDGVNKKLNYDIDMSMVVKLERFNCIYSKKSSYFYVYDRKSNSFIDSFLIDFSGVAEKNECLSDQLRKHNNYEPLEKGSRVLLQYTFKDYLKMVRKSVKAIKKINN